MNTIPRGGTLYKIRFVEEKVNAHFEEQQRLEQILIEMAGRITLLERTNKKNRRGF